jgi:hypothetical protein
MILGNIVCKDEIKVSEIFKVVKSINDIDKTLPTLIVGFDLICELYPDFDILEFKVDTNHYWTFKRTEKRDKYEEDLSKFTHVVYSKLINNIKYLHIDFLLHKPKQLKRILRKILSAEKVISVQYKDNVFIYLENLIFGLDLEMLRYMRFNVDKLLSKIKLKSLTFLQDDTIFIKYKREIQVLGNKVYFLPLLYSIKNENQ